MNIVEGCLIQDSSSMKIEWQRGKTHIPKKKKTSGNIREKCVDVRQEEEDHGR